MDKDLLPVLQKGLSDLELELSQETQEKIIEYIALLCKWNKVYSLTAIRDPKEVLIRHIFDSLAIASYVVGPNVLDFGSGGGLPGIPLALALLEYNFVLLDSVEKKTNFLKHVVLELGIENVKVETKRIEEFSFSLGFDTIITRATTTLEEVVNKNNRLLARKGQILVMKGKYPTEELKAITIKPTEVHCVKVPRLDEERHLVKIT